MTTPKVKTKKPAKVSPKATKAVAKPKLATVEAALLNAERLAAAVEDSDSSADVDADCDSSVEDQAALLNAEPSAESTVEDSVDGAEVSNEVLPGCFEFETLEALAYLKAGIKREIKVSKLLAEIETKFDIKFEGTRTNVKMVNPS